MKRRTRRAEPPAASRAHAVDLSALFNFPRGRRKEEWWRRLAEEVRNLPTGSQTSWGIPFQMSKGAGGKALVLGAEDPAATVGLNRTATHLCFLHAWRQIPTTVQREDPREGLVVAEYALTYADGSIHVQPIRARFEVAMLESPGGTWLAVPFVMTTSRDPVKPVGDRPWGLTQYGIDRDRSRGQPQVLLYALPNPYPGRKIRSLTIRALQQSPLLVAGITLFNGKAHPFAHLPRRTYRVKTPGGPACVREARVDLGSVARVERTTGPRGKRWLDSEFVGTMNVVEPERGAEDLLEIFGAEDAAVSVDIQGEKGPRIFTLGDAFREGRSHDGTAALEVLGRRRQWMEVRVIDRSTGRPTPARVHFSGPRGEYLPPYGHHAQVNTNFFEEYGADVVVGGRNYAYVPGIFATDLPVGDLYVELNKGLEYEPVRMKVTVRPGQKTLDLGIERWKDLRRENWVTADTHVHFISPQTAWLEGQAEGVNVVNLLASQWGRMFTNVGDLTGRVGVVENDTIVFVGTENRHHMLGHMSMLGTQGMPVYPMCGGGITEAWVGDPDFLSLTDWARENRSRGGVVIRPHFPQAGHTEDPVSILQGLVDALELRELRGESFPVQEWYRYLNCGYRVAVAGGTDKMNAATPLGWLRTYARVDGDKAFTYAAWAEAVRAGRTFSTNGPLISFTVEGRDIGETITMPGNGGTLEVRSVAESYWPLGKIEIVHNGRVVAAAGAERGAKRLEARERIAVSGSGWLAARCSGYAGHPASYVAAHTSPVYVECGDRRLFSGPAAEHMLALVEGGIEYVRTLCTAYDEPTRRRMVKTFNEARRELRGRLRVEGHVHRHSASGPYHIHGHTHGEKLP